MSLAVAIVIGGSACLKKDPLFCNEGKPCTDPERPFCDLEGVHPASEGHGKTCIPDPFVQDAGSDDSATPSSDATAVCQQSILFMRGVGFSFIRTVFTVDPDGTDLTEIQVGAYVPAWSADGQRMSYSQVENGGVLRLYVADRDGANRTPVAGDASFSAGRSAWSPDGRYIAFEGTVVSGMGGDTTDIYVYELGTGNLFNLSNHPAVDEEISWAPGGDALLFVSERDGNREIYRSTIEAQPTLVNLTNNPASDDRPDWGRASNQVLFVSRRIVSRGDEIYRMDEDGTAVLQISNRGGDDHGPRWSTDGTKIAFVSGEDRLVVAGPDGTAQVEVAEFLYDGDQLDWGQDDRIVYSKITPNSNGNIDVYLVGFDGTGEVRVTTDEEDAFTPTFSPCP